MTSGYRRRMIVPFGADLSTKQRLEVARVSGTGQRWGRGTLRDRPLEEAVAAVHVDSQDPVVLGIALGAALAGLQLDGMPWNDRLVALYRAAGADEQVAAVNLAWQRHRRNRMGPR